MTTTTEPRFIWINPETGEFSETEQEGWQQEEIQEDLLAAGAIQSDPRALLEWLGATIAEIEAQISSREAYFQEKIEALQASMNAQVGDQRRRLDYLFWAYGEEAKRATQTLLPLKKDGTPKKKSVDTDFRRFGFSAGRERIDLHDEPAALAWATEHAPDAVSYPDPYVRKSDLPAEAVRAGEVPGVRVTVPDEKWYCKPVPARKGSKK